MSTIFTAGRRQKCRLVCNKWAGRIFLSSLLFCFYFLSQVKSVVLYRGAAEHLGAKDHFGAEDHVGAVKSSRGAAGCRPIVKKLSKGATNQKRLKSTALGNN